MDNYLSLCIFPYDILVSSYDRHPQAITYLQLRAYRVLYLTACSYCRRSKCSYFGHYFCFAHYYSYPATAYSPWPVCWLSCCFADCSSSTFSAYSSDCCLIAYCCFPSAVCCCRPGSSTECWCWSLLSICVAYYWTFGSIVVWSVSGRYQLDC